MSPILGILLVVIGGMAAAFDDRAFRFCVVLALLMLAFSVKV